MKILIADDDITSRTLLKAALSKWGYMVVSTSDGKEAWEALQQDDSLKLAVFDWVMPGLDGVELCKRLKEKKNISYVYTILLTSKSEKEDLVTAFDSGADDFITKPFDPNELKSRLSVGIRILEYEALLAKKTDQISRYASQMEALAEDRAKQLVHADRMATLGVMSAGIAHEINNPLTLVSSNIQILKKIWGKIDKVFVDCLKKDCSESKDLDYIMKNIPETLDGVHNGARRISRIVKGLRVYTYKDKGEQSTCSLNNCIDEALELCNNALKYHVTVEKQFDKNLPEIQANAQQLEQVFINLFVNATHAMESQKKGTLKITTSRKDRLLCAEIVDNGPGIPEDKIKNIWEPFYTTKAVGKGTGLGLSISQKIINSHGGTIRVENNQDGGVRFIIELPFQES